MKFVKLSFDKNIKFTEFIQFWSRFYEDPFEKLYSESIFKNRFTDDDIIQLFRWKNGGNLSQKKANSLKRIIDKMDIVNSLKSNFCLSIFQEKFNEISVIWKIFLLHIIAPKNYPIFDQHVYRAFYFLKESRIKEIPSNDSKKEKIYFSDYVKFFSSLANRKVSRKKLDEALWVFGKFLKTGYGKNIVLFSYNTKSVIQGNG